MPGALLEIRNLTVRYVPESGDPVTAVDDASLHLQFGEVVGILGESGSGKSTMAAAIMRLLPAGAECAGSVTFADRDILTMKEDELRATRGRHISIVPQDPASSLNPVMRAGTQISEVLRAHMDLGPTERKQRVHQLLSEVGFDDPKRIAASYPHQLSGGQRQRVVIAQAIACEPALVIADEPTSKLDAPLQIEIVGLISGLIRARGTALLWITHDPATLVGFADRLAIMNAGRIVENGATQDVFRRPVHPYTEKLMRFSQQFALSAAAAAGRL